MSLLRFCQWLATTRGSVIIHESLWGYPAVATVHVMALSLSVGMIAILDLRLLGVRMPRVPVSEIADRLLPWIATGFAVVILSGLLLVYSDPVRYYPNIFLRFKILVLIAAGVNAWVFHRSVYRDVAQWDLSTVAPRRARVAGMLSLSFLAVIILAGRMIAYYDEWFDCDRQPHSAIVNKIAGCTDSP
jgi:Family of unknown function (DUF6644)